MQVLTMLLTMVLLGASAWAVRQDLLTHKVPNRLTGSVLCAGLLLQAIAAGWTGLGHALGGALVGLGVLLPFYLLRTMGAGDVKLLAALGSLLDPHWALIAGLCTLIAGGVLGLGYLLGGALRAAVSAPEMPWQSRIYSAFGRARALRRERFPYATAIATGAIAAIAERGDLQRLLGQIVPGAAG